MTIDEALNHPLLAKIRNPQKEILRFKINYILKLLVKRK